MKGGLWLGLISFILLACEPVVTSPRTAAEKIIGGSWVLVSGTGGLIIPKTASDTLTFLENGNMVENGVVGDWARTLTLDEISVRKYDEMNYTKRVVVDRITDKEMTVRHDDMTGKYKRK